MGKTSDGSQVLHVQAEKADDLDLSDLYPDAHVVSDSEISSKLHTKIIVEFLKATCKRTQQLPKLLGKQCWELLRPLRPLRLRSGVQRDSITSSSVGTCSASWDGLDSLMGCILV